MALRPIFRPVGITDLKCPECGEVYFPRNEPVCPKCRVRWYPQEK